MGAILDLPEIRARVHRWTVADYEKLGDDPAFRRCELIRGMIVEKISKTSLHEYLTEGIAEYFRQACDAGVCIRQEASLLRADSVPEPDVAVVEGSRGDFRERKPTTAALVVEVAVTSLAMDREKASLYAEAGVKEYWIVLAETERVEVYRQPVDGIYQEQRTYERGEMIGGVNVAVQPVPVDALFA